MDSRRRDQLAIFILALVVRLTTAFLISQPGYMDTAYYAVGAIRIAQGEGFSEPFIWNYLNDPPGIPHPGFLYWMPLPSLLGAPLAALFPGSFFVLQIPFAMLSALVSAIAYDLSWQATGNKRSARAGGLLAIFSGFFFPYWTLPETFAPFALFGSLALWLAGKRCSKDSKAETKIPRWLLVGMLAGLAHLTRADGILLLPVVALAPLVRSQAASSGGQGRARLLKTATVQLLVLVLGYMLVMGPWFARNTVVTGTPLSPAGTKTIWLTEYDDIFCYDCDLSPSSYLAWGWDNILRSKLTALWINAQRFLAEGCLVFLLPFVIMGFYHLRCRLSFALAAVYLVVIYFVHSLIFTFPGWRGGFFHASSAVLPFLHAVGLQGLAATINQVAQRRQWTLQQAQRVFTSAVVVAAGALSVYVLTMRLTNWNRSDEVYGRVDHWLDDHQVPDMARVMLNDPPSFWYHTQRVSLVTPNEDIQRLLQVANRYEADYLLIEEDHLAPLTALYAGDEIKDGFDILAKWEEKEQIVLYSIKSRLYK